VDSTSGNLYTPVYSTKRSAMRRSIVILCVLATAAALAPAAAALAPAEAPRYTITAPSADAWRATLASAICADAGAGRLLLVTASAPAGSPPRDRRAHGAPAVRLLLPHPSAAAAQTAVSIANRLLLAAEGPLLGGRRAFPMQILFADVRPAAAAAAAGCDGGSAAAAPALPYALFDAATGLVVIDASALELLAATLRVPEQAAAVVRLAEVALEALGGVLQQVGLGWLVCFIGWFAAC